MILCHTQVLITFLETEHYYSTSTTATSTSARFTVYVVSKLHATPLKVIRQSLQQQLYYNTGQTAMSTFSPVGMWSSDGMRMSVCACVREHVCVSVCVCEHVYVCV